MAAARGARRWLSALFLVSLIIGRVSVNDWLGRSLTMMRCGMSTKKSQYFQTGPK
jgi:hypothetical protein